MHGEGLRAKKKKRKKCERSRRREMKTEAERNGGDQRHVEFTITLLGCTVIKERSPQRVRRLQACPVRSLASLISSVSPTERQHQNLQEGLFLLQPHHHHQHHQQQLQRICKASTDCHEASSFQGEGGLTPMSRCSSRGRFSSFFFFFDDLMKISCTFLNAPRYP